MKIVLKDKRRYLIRFDKGENVVSGLADVVTQEKLTACVFFGGGSVSEIELGYFNKNLKDYRKKPYYDDMELISFSGNGAFFEGKPVIHCYGQFGHTDFTTLGGRVFKMVVSSSVEIFLIALDGQATRQTNPDFNLDLLV